MLIDDWWISFKCMQNIYGTLVKVQVLVKAMLRASLGVSQLVSVTFVKCDWAPIKVTICARACVCVCLVVIGSGPLQLCSVLRLVL